MSYSTDSLVLNVIFCTFLLTGNCERILFITSVPSYSHFQVASTLAKELANRGHAITIISRFPQEKRIENYTDVAVMDLPTFDNTINIFKALDLTSPCPYRKMYAIMKLSTRCSEIVLNNHQVQKLLKSDKKFDLVVLEYFQNHALFGFAHRFKAPLIILSPTAAGALNNFMTSRSHFSAYIPNFTTSFNTEMNFWQRMQNFMMNLYTDYLLQWLAPRIQADVFNRNFPGASLEELLYNASLVFTNAHYSVYDPAPMQPNVIEIGGFHIRKNPAKLPTDIKEFLDNAHEGVILFAMGSALQVKDVPAETLLIFKNAFARTKLKVLWKFEGSMQDVPENVKLVDWLPQQEVLAHPNIKTFIFHGGQLTIMECVYFGVPFIALPVFGDHYANVARSVKNGFAIQLDLKCLTEKDLLYAINEITENPKYKEQAVLRSSFLRDQPIDPLDKAVYYVEYVLRHRGAPHLKTGAHFLNWYQRNLIDVWLFLILLGAAIILLVLKSCQWIVLLLFKMQKPINVKTGKLAGKKVQ